MRQKRRGNRSARVPPKNSRAEARARCRNSVVGRPAGGTFRLSPGWPGMTVAFNFTPELHLRDGRIVRDVEDAIAFAREQEPRPGVDERDEALHRLERAETREQAHAAGQFFVRWLEGLEIVK